MIFFRINAEFWLWGGSDKSTDTRRYDIAMHYYIFFFSLRLLLYLNLSRCCAVLMYDILIYILKAWTQKQDRCVT